MTRYIQFTSDNSENTTILVEVTDEDISTPQGLVKAGIKDRVKDTISLAQSTFSEAIRNAIQCNVQGMISAIHSLPEPPTEIEITFGLKATGEAGNVAVCKGGGEVNYTVKLAWKPLSSPK